MPTEMVAVNGNTSSMDEILKKYKDVNPFLINKWERIFTIFFDRNCSNNVDWGDFYLVVRKVREVYGSESVQITYARKTLESLWKGLCKVADINKDSLITLDEWVQLLRKVNLKEKEPKEPKWLDDYQAFMFKLFDVSGDGVLDQAEYADGMTLYGFRYEDNVDNFTKIAFDAHGKPVEHITPALWKTLFYELFFSADKSRPGNLLFGKSLYSKAGSSAEKCTLDKAMSVDKPNTKSAQMVKANSQE